MKHVIISLILLFSSLSLLHTAHAEEISLKNRTVLTPKNLFNYKQSDYEPYILSVSANKKAHPTLQGYPVLGFSTKEVEEWVGCCAGLGMTVILLADSPKGNVNNLKKFASTNKCIINPKNEKSEKELWGVNEGAIASSALYHKESIIETLKKNKQAIPSKTLSLVCWNED